MGAVAADLDRTCRSRGQRASCCRVEKRALVAGENLIDAQQSFDQGGLPVVSFKFDSVGARKFGDATSKNVGKRFAIVLDDKIISAPVIKDAILGGSGIISGNFTVDRRARPGPAAARRRAAGDR